MADGPHHVIVDVDDPERKRQALALILRMYAAGVGVDPGGGAPFFDEAMRITMELLGDLGFGEGTSDETMDELANRVVHLLHWSTVVGFRALVMVDEARGGLDYMAALREIETFAESVDET